MEKKFFILTVVFLGLTVASYLHVIKVLDYNSRKILSDAGYLFQDAMKQYYYTRLKNVEGYYFIPDISKDWPSGAITITTKNGTRTRKDVRSIRALPVEEKVRLVRETGLLEKNPIDPDIQNSFFRQILNERDIHIQTGVRYTEVERKITRDSANDSLFFATAHPLEEYRTGIFNEIALQAYVKLPFTAVVERAGHRFLLPVFGWILVLSVYIAGIILLARREKKERERLASAPEGLSVETLRLDTEKYCLYYKDREVQLTTSLGQLMELFLNSPGYFLTKEAIADELWKGLDDPSNRLSQIISRLRSALSPIGEIEIENVRRIGFRLIVR